MQIIHTDAAPAAIGPYSQAVRCANTVYLSGQIALDPLTMQLCGPDIKSQTEQVLKNLTAVCEASGGGLRNIVKLTIYLIDLNHFTIVNDIMQQFFQTPYPARATIGVAALPRDAIVEMDAVLVLPQP